jgi:two-component system OmpR family sensor kinase
MKRGGHRHCHDHHDHRDHQGHHDHPDHPDHRDGPRHGHHGHHHPWHGRWRSDIRRYYGAHLHRRLFVWFGAAIFVTALVIAALVHIAGGSFGPPWNNPWSGAAHERRLPGVVFFLVPAAVLWILSGKIAKRLARPLYELVLVSEEIGKGTTSARARVTDHGLDEIAALGRAINDMAARIERQLADQRELLAAVSHELRTPLGHLRVILDLARDRDAADGKLWNEVERELVEMDRLVGELLASARLEFQALSPKPLDAAGVAARALERAGLPASKLVARAAEGGRFSGDPTLVGRALANLIDNAQKHGGGLTRIEVASAPGFVRFVVEDGGPGFSPDEMPRAFEAFAPADTSLGLGLSLVARIARAHGGSIAAANRPEGGARITLELAVGGVAA